MSKNNMYACECGCKQIVCGECKRAFGVDEEHECKMVEKKESTMSEKVKLPKEVCDALDYAKKHIPNNLILKYTDRCDWRAPETIILNDLLFNTVMQALVLGYEPELSAEELTMQLWSKSGGYVKDGIRDALRIHGIRYVWMGDAECHCTTDCT